MPREVIVYPNGTVCEDGKFGERMDIQAGRSIRFHGVKFTHQGTSFTLYCDEGSLEVFGEIDGKPIKETITGLRKDITALKVRLERHGHTLEKHGRHIAAMKNNNADSEVLSPP